MPEVDQCIGERFEGVMHLTEVLKAIQQSAELVFPRKHSLNCAKSLVENSLLEEGLATSLGNFSLVTGNILKKQVKIAEWTLSSRNYRKSVTKTAHR